MLYGGDFNPEQWPRATLAEDLELMRQARVTAVTVGVFAWSLLEPAEGRYGFAWLDRVLDGLAEAGIGAVLATPTASPPPWFSLAHPEALPVTAGGVRLSHGSRDTYCVSAPAYRKACRRIAAALAARYHDHPALLLWRVHNEYGTTCHCDLTAAAFRQWLRDRHGTLDALNDAWTTAFWGQRYTAWEQIRPPVATQYLGNPAQLLDFKRFTSDELLTAYLEQRDEIRARAPGVPVTTNYVLGDWVPVDHARWSSEVDLVAIDHYPSAAGPQAEEQAAFAYARARGWAGPGRDWLLMETAPATLHVPGRAHPKEPGRMATQALAAVAHGSRGAMFFQWRASRGGAETYHSALVPHAGPDSRVFREAVDLGAQLSTMASQFGEAGPGEPPGRVEASPGAAAGRVEALAAVVLDAASVWAVQATPMPADRLSPTAEAERAHAELRRNGIVADVVPGGTSLTAYRLVILPMHYLIPDDEAATLRSWVAAGGHLVVTFLSGIADTHGRVRTGGYPGALRDLLGIRVEEFHPGPDGDWRETVHLTGATAARTYPDGTPSVTRHAVGEGHAWYVSTRVDGLLAEVAAEAGLTPVALPPGVEEVRQTRGGTSWTFRITHPTGGVELHPTGDPGIGLPSPEPAESQPRLG